MFYALDSAEVSADGQKILNANAEILRKYPTWVITIEGHADERGTAEYNLALGERRAGRADVSRVARDPCRSAEDRKLRREFPFDPGHDESAWAKNRRAHFVVTSK